MNEKAIRARSALTDKWQPLGKWAMVKGPLTIAKFVQNGQNVYVRFDGERRVGQYASFAEAQQERKAA